MATKAAEQRRPTVVCYVRHGATPTTGKILPGRTKGLHLAERGCAEAELAGARLAGVGPVAALYSSPLERARETAQFIAKALGKRIVIASSLLECDFGEWTGAELRSLAKLPEWSVVQHAPSSFRFPGGESFVELQARLAGFAERMRREHPGETVVAVSHADPIKVALAAALGSPLDLLQRIGVSTGSISVVAYSSAGPSVISVNSTTELGPLGPAPAPEKRSRASGAAR